MSSNSVARRWTDGPVKFLGIGFGLDFQVDKNGDVVTSKVANFTFEWAKRKLSLKGETEVDNAYIEFVIYYYLTIAPYSVSRLTKLIRFFFRFLWKRRVPLAIPSTCCQQLLNGVLSMPWSTGHALM